MEHSYTHITEGAGYRLSRRDDGKYTVVGVGKHQIYSAMPGDMPASENGAGRWFAKDTPSGMDYVSSGYSESYARRVFRQLVAESA